MPAGIIGGRIYFDITTPMDIPHVWYGPFAVWSGGLGIWGGVLVGGLVGIWRLRQQGREPRAVRRRHGARAADGAGRRADRHLKPPDRLDYLKKTIAAYRRTLAIDSENVAAHYGLGVAYGTPPWGEKRPSEPAAEANPSDAGTAAPIDAVALLSQRETNPFAMLAAPVIRIERTPRSAIPYRRLGSARNIRDIR